MPEPQPPPVSEAPLEPEPAPQPPPELEAPPQPEPAPQPPPEPEAPLGVEPAAPQLSGGNPAAASGAEPVLPPDPMEPGAGASDHLASPVTAAPAEASAGGTPRRPQPPPRASARRAGGRRTHAPALRRRAGGRSLPTRALAVLALAGVAVAIVLLVKSLAGSGKVTKAPVATVVRVVVPEGSTRLQIAHIAAKDGLKGSYRGASKRSALLDPARYGAPAGTPDLEGFLFPATYDVYPGAPVSRLVHEQLVAFGENFGPTEIARARSLHVTPYQLLTVASMIEREAKVPGDRAKIAAVIYNRLRRGMPLGIDATIYYALELQRNIPTYTKELTEAQLQLDSPYNTRTRTGLPPTPISNPGMASIEAAANPAHVSYLYYVLAPDGCGEHVFSTTLAKFEADAAAYQAAVRKNGGAPPVCKK
ncbi:MAG TPA: endolytic transglycosylase MltG [Solirubrobacteraceae bacterium]|nr:endolytic transglycosylase MltG [Solirubrobacteraceae bacterium]